jgi:Protein of unknown function (DUF1570)
MRWFQFAAVISLILLVGCHGLPHAPLSPLPNGHETPVGQLVFHSDFELPHDHRLVRELVEEREYVSSTLGMQTTNEPIEIYLFRDKERYSEYLLRNFPNVPSRRAFFLETDTRLTVYAHWSDRVGEDLRHETAHGYLHAAIPNLPLWIDEGLAEYFEVPRGYAGLNQPHVDLLSDSIERDHWKPNLKRLESLTESSQMGQREYAEAWSWVYFLLNSPPERREILTGYLAELRTKGSAASISARMGAIQVQPEGPLVKYIATLKKDAVLK